MDHPRACAAILDDDRILMVCHRTPSRMYWTLPGGGAENDETLEQSVTREVKEETGLDAKSLRLLFEKEYEYGTRYYYLAELCNERVEPITGFDPEEGELPALDRLIQSVAWILIKDIKNDRQVSKVISALGLKHD